MQNLDPSAPRQAHSTRPILMGCLLLVLTLLLPGTGRAQAPGWVSGISIPTAYKTLATAVDSRGNVLMTGTFFGTLAFGSTMLTSAGGTDIFVAKYVPSTNTWAWAQRGGGTGHDYGLGVAVSGSSVYVTGYIVNNTSDINQVRFGGTAQNGASVLSSEDLVVAKYTDNGNSATLGWTQVGGGTGEDRGYGIAANGSSVYVTGQIANTTNGDVRSVRFGGSGTVPGTVQQNGAGGKFDLLVAKYTDNGSSATLGWTQVGGGIEGERGHSIAVSGTSVYVTGHILNTPSDFYSVRFGGSGTTPSTVQVNGAGGGLDLLVAKYTDYGTSATLGWTQVGGGTEDDIGYGIAVNGSSVYVTGYISNTRDDVARVRFGGSGTTPGTALQTGASAFTFLAPDLVVAKYTDNGSSATLGWTQVGGGGHFDVGYGIAVSGSSVYVTGRISNTTTDVNTVRFGGSGITPGTVQVLGVGTDTFNQDLVLAKYTDNGSSATLGWAQVGGGESDDRGRSIVISGQKLLVGGFVTFDASFGTFTVPSRGPDVNQSTEVLLTVLDPTLVPETPAGPLVLFPNPTREGAATLTGAEPGTEVRVIDVLGRSVATATTDSTGTAELILPPGLPSGMYIVLSGTRALRLQVE
ncbi:T9SS type A sorting domain-containing protein [Hymenobacter sp. BT175]|uniref:T9SS type A sorting domain-containing protein n=1 Tax=Hymenobacter translucens TaxID=2886507 RepID=UPI001D0E7A0A|nr:T9SS type A sorting domain-containing protein [Hymenobacter translucens]MCC2544873.1 T9SS type A sorting domain-containing protein [Hymenobacter translucens]